ncbi:MAG: hypothetical protein J6O50_10000 [Ruminiclostridium sp.]|nr:hypothetical protein [Ruminiclostridium sp.]
MVYFGYFFEYRKGKAHIGISNDTKVREFKDYWISDIVRQLYEFSANYDALKTGVENLCKVLTSSKGERKAAMEPLEALSMNDNICLKYIIARLFDDFGNAETDFGSGKQSLATFINGLTLPMNIEKKRKKWQSELMNTFTRLTAPFVSIEGTLNNPDSTATAVICGDKQYTVCADTLDFFICDLHRGCEKHDIKIKRCEVCGKMFAPTNSKVKYCSTDCSKQARNDNIQKARTNDESDPLKREVKRSISNMKNHDKKVKDAFGADSEKYARIHASFIGFKEEIRSKRERLTRDIGRDKIDVNDALDILCRFDKEREKKMVNITTAAMYSLRD